MVKRITIDMTEADVEAYDRKLIIFFIRKNQHSIKRMSSWKRNLLKIEAIKSS
jgi:hypothetical protein